MVKVAGIGGVFIDSDDAARLTNWYQEVLGIEMETHPEGGSYKVFQTRDLEGSFVRENPVFAINQAKEPLVKNGRGFTINLRVDNLEQMLAHLRKQGVQVEDKTIEWEGGKHAWIRDLDNNRIELYEELFDGKPR
ncbi:MAG: VOC family protein [Chloroflexi bacterium]|nr:MAG: VOC family protein [Chloroflexota bacterium]